MPPRAGLIRSMLLGQGREALERAVAKPLISETGAFAAPSEKGVLNKVKHIIVGDRPVQQTKQRFLQGGLVGKGGVLRGPLALDHALVQSMQQHGGYFGALRHDPGTVIPASIAAPVNPAFILGIPGYAAYKANQRGESMGGPLGEGLGFMAAAPFGMAGILAARAGHHIGEQMLPAPRPPPIQNVEGGYVPYDAYQAEKSANTLKSGHVLSPPKVL